MPFGQPPSPPEPPHPRPRYLSVILAAALIAGTGWVLFRRHVGGSSPLDLAVIGLTPWLLGAVSVAAIAIWRLRQPPRRTVFALLAGWMAVSTWLVAVVWPVGAVVGCLTQPEPAPDDAITIYTHNVLFGQSQPDAIAAAIATEQADIVLLQEVSSSVRSTLIDHPLLVEYPHRAQDAGGPLGGLVIFSRWPMANVEAPRFVVSDYATATIQAPQGDFQISNIHTLAPARPGNIEAWKAQFDQLAETDTDSPKILAGDFNATVDHRPMRQLLDRGWTDVHDVKGCGIDNTWPSRFVPFPLLRLDHILVTEHFEVVDLRIGEPSGSDHRPVVAEIRLNAP